MNEDKNIPTNNVVIIQYEVKDNPACPSFELEWKFPDTMDQNEMMMVMDIDIQKKLMQLNPYHTPVLNEDILSQLAD